MAAGAGAAGAASTGATGATGAIELFAGLLAFGGGGFSTATLIAGTEASVLLTGVATTGSRGGVRSTTSLVCRWMWPSPNAIANTPINTPIMVMKRRRSTRRPMGLIRRRSIWWVLMMRGRVSVCPHCSGSRSLRIGSRPRRGMKRVSLPISPAFVTRISSVVPAASDRAKRGKDISIVPPDPARLPTVATRLSEVEWTPTPLIRTVTRAEIGAATVSSVSLTPFLVSRPAILTIGNGCIRVTAWWRTLIVCLAVLERPAASVTCRRTTCGPGVVKVVVVVERPVWNGSVALRPHANEVIGELASVELETSVTVSPTRGSSGNHVKEALGGGGGGGARSVIGTAALVPTLPAASVCCASSV